MGDHLVKAGTVNNLRTVGLSKQSLIDNKMYCLRRKVKAVLTLVVIVVVASRSSTTTKDELCVKNEERND